MGTIVNERIVDYINSLDKGNSPVCNAIEKEALADGVPIMRKEMGNLLKVLLLLKQAQKMQADMAELQADLEQREYTATSGGGMIEVTVDGKHRIKALKINPDAVDPEDTEMLEDLITVAVNEAVANAEKTAEDEMGAITGGLNMPGLF